MASMLELSVFSVEAGPGRYLGLEITKSEHCGRGRGNGYESQTVSSPLLWPLTAASISPAAAALPLLAAVERIVPFWGCLSSRQEGDRGCPSLSRCHLLAAGAARSEEVALVGLEMKFSVGFVLRKGVFL